MIDVARQFISFRSAFSCHLWRLQTYWTDCTRSIKTREAAAILAAWTERIEYGVVRRACRIRINYGRCKRARHRGIQLNWSINPGSTPGAARRGPGRPRHDAETAAAASHGRARRRRGRALWPAFTHRINVNAAASSRLTNRQTDTAWCWRRGVKWDVTTLFQPFK